MSDSMVAVTYHYACLINEVRQHPGGELERTGNRRPGEIERTIIVPKRLVQEMLKIDIESISRGKEGFTLLGNERIREVAMTYPAPHYWG